jgi:hypothetical protein
MDLNLQECQSRDEHEYKDDLIREAKNANKRGKKTKPEQEAKLG